MNLDIQRLFGLSKVLRNKYDVIIRILPSNLREPHSFLGFRQIESGFTWDNGEYTFVMWMNELSEKRKLK